MPVTPEGLQRLHRDWIDAEIRGDVAALDAMAVADFTLVGPVGFVIDKAQWLDRYRGGDLRTSALSLDEERTRVYDTVAVTVARRTQEAAHRGRPVNGAFRATHVAVRDGDRWRLASQHLSPIAPPPGAGR